MSGGFPVQLRDPSRLPFAAIMPWLRTKEWARKLTRWEIRSALLRAGDEWETVCGMTDTDLFKRAAVLQQEPIPVKRTANA